MVYRQALDGGIDLGLAPANDRDLSIIVGYHLEVSGNNQTIVYDLPAGEDGTLVTTIRGLVNGISYVVSAFIVTSQGQRVKPATVIVRPGQAPTTAQMWASTFPNPVLFLHGYNSNASAWDVVSAYLKDQGWSHERLRMESDVIKGSGPNGTPLRADFYTLTFSNDNNQNVCVQSIHLGKYLAAIRQVTDARQVVVVGHSQGAIAARAYMQVGPNPERFFDRYSPFSQGDDVFNSPHGTACALAYDGVSPFFANDVSAIITYGAPHNGTDDLAFGPSLIRPGSKFLQVLNGFADFPLPPGLSIVNLKGKTSPVASSDCIVSVNSQDMQNLEFQAPGTFRNPTISWRRHERGKLGCLLEGGIFRTPETEDYANIVEALGGLGIHIGTGSPVGLQIVAPDGAILSVDRRELWAASYEEHVDEGGELKTVIDIPFPLPGEYHIEVVPKPGAQPTDIYTLEVTQNGQTVVLAQNQQIQNIPSQGYAVTVLPPNQIPIANAGPNQTVRLGSLVTLNGGGSSDPDNGPGPLTYLWTQTSGPTVSVSAATTANPTFTPAVAGTYTFSLIVNDGQDNSAPANVTLTIREPTIVNNLVTFAPINSSIATTSNASGCPAGFVGKFSFNARLIDKNTSPPLSDLMAKVTTLSNGNLLQNADGGPAGVGATLTVPKAGNFSDGLLSPNEFVDVPFTICLKQMKAFSFFVDVLGVTQ